MSTLRSLAIAVTAATVLAALPSTNVRACDDDRFPCPLVETQETADAPSRVAPQPRKKATRAAPRNEKPRAKVEQTRREPEAKGVAAVPNAVAPASPEHAADSGSHKQPALALPLNEEVDRNESPVAAAAAAWLVLPKAEGDGAQAGADQTAADEGTTVAASADGSPAADVQLVDPNEVNELDLAAAPAPAQTSWLGYLVMTLGAALAAASTVRFFFFV
jgi:hypothetical protein